MWLPPNFQYQDEKQVAADQGHLFKKCKRSPRLSSARVSLHFGIENGGTDKNHPVTLYVGFVISAQEKKV